MIAPVLVFATSPTGSFSDLKAPAGFYVVSAQNAKGDISLVLGHRNSESVLGVSLPRVIIFHAEDAASNILVLSGNCLDGHLLEPHIEANLRKVWTAPFASPSKGTRNSAFYAAHTSQTAAGKTHSSKNLEYQYALMRATHSDPAKMTRLKIYSQETKLSDPSVLLQIINNIDQESLRNLAVMLPQNLPLLLAMNFCVQPDVTTKQLNALHPTAFLPSTDGGNLRSYEGVDQVVLSVRNAKAVFLYIFGELRTDPEPFYGVIFNALLEGLQDTGDRTTVRHLKVNFIANRVAKLFISWANLFVFENLSLGKTEFRQLCMEALSFNPHEWRQDAVEGDAAMVPLQATYETNLLKRKDNPGLKPAGTAGNKGKEKPKEKYADKRVKNANVPAAVAGARAMTLCIKNLMHQNVPAHFPDDCTRTPCARKHDAVLANGRLTAGDKKAVTSDINSMKSGTFKTLCLAHLKSL
jgi:hypothetical protein